MSFITQANNRLLLSLRVDGKRDGAPLLTKEGKKKNRERVSESVANENVKGFAKASTKA